MLKKSLLIFLFLGSINSTYGWFGWGGSSEETDPVPRFTQEILDEFTLSDATSRLEVMQAFIKATRMSKKNCEKQIRKIAFQVAQTVQDQDIETDQLKKLATQLDPRINYREKMVSQLAQAEANCDALQAQINCYLKQVQDNLLTQPDDAQEDTEQEEFSAAKAEENSGASLVPTEKAKVKEESIQKA